MWLFFSITDLGLAKSPSSTASGKLYFANSKLICFWVVSTYHKITLSLTSPIPFSGGRWWRESGAQILSWHQVGIEPLVFNYPVALLASAADGRSPQVADVRPGHSVSSSSCPSSFGSPGYSQPTWSSSWELWDQWVFPCLLWAETPFSLANPGHPSSSVLCCLAGCGIYMKGLEPPLAMLWE